jgi:hypothetical protein
MTSSKITQGLNDRPKDAPIGQTAAGLPDDDTSMPPEIDEEEAARIEQRIRAMGSKGSPESQTKDEVQQDIDLPLKGSA